MAIRPCFPGRITNPSYGQFGKSLFFSAFARQSGAGDRPHGPERPDTVEAARIMGRRPRRVQHERTVVFARLREPEAVDDVMQEVALAAVRQAAPIADPAKAAPWLYRLAVRQALLFRRRCGRRRRLAERYTDRVVTPGHEGNGRSPLDWLLRRERCRLVREALARLAPRDSEILLLKYGEGWNYHQIAARLGVSHSAVETRLHRARNRLRSELVAREVSPV